MVSASYFVYPGIMWELLKRPERHYLRQAEKSREEEVPGREKDDAEYPDYQSREDDRLCSQKMAFLRIIIAPEMSGSRLEDLQTVRHSLSVGHCVQVKRPFHVVFDATK